MALMPQTRAVAGGGGRGARRGPVPGAPPQGPHPLLARLRDGGEVRPGRARTEAPSPRGRRPPRARRGQRQLLAAHPEGPTAPQGSRRREGLGDPRVETEGCKGGERVRATDSQSQPLRSAAARQRAGHTLRWSARHAGGGRCA